MKSPCMAQFSPQISDKEQIERLKLDFCKTEDQLLHELSVYGLDSDTARIRRWEAEKKIEYALIDDEKLYFRNAVPNLFRLDPEAFAAKQNCSLFPEEDVWVRVPRSAAMHMLNANPYEGELFLPNRFEISFIIDLPAVHLSDCEDKVRCWLPAPQISSFRQKEVRYITHKDQFNLNRSNNPMHAAVYLEQNTPDNRGSLVFETQYSFTSYAQHYSLNYLFKKAKPQKRNTLLYKYYTQERQKHIRFIPEIRNLGDSLRDPNSDVQTIKNIFDYISDNIPWCSALEYSNIENIPKYVLSNRHGDCGQVSLLFITLARYCGIPAKWQSGWMLHPGAENLHDWAEVYIEGIGWIPVDASFGRINHPNPLVAYYYLGGIDSYRLVINEDFSEIFYPAKQFYRSEPVDFQRGEVETSERNLYFDKWKYKISVKNISL